MYNKFMNIERATTEHVPFIYTRLADIKKKPESPLEIKALIESPDNAIFVDTQSSVVCRLYHNKEKEVNHVAWLLPQNEQKVELYLVMCNSLLEISRRFPEDDHFTTRARFADRRGCLSIFNKSGQAKQAVETFQKLFPKSSKYQFRFSDWSYIIWGQQGEIVQDINESPLYQYYKKEEGTLEPQIARL